MSKNVEFYFDFGSPTAYLAFTQLPAIANRHSAELVWKPVLLGGIFKTAGTRSPMESPAKAHYMLTDLTRFAVRYGVPIRFNPHFPVNTLTLMRGATAMQMHEPGRLPDYVAAVFRGMWVDGLDLGDEAVFASLVTASGFEAPKLLEQARDAAVKQKLIDGTAEACSRGLFGVPTMFVANEMFFGEDRLDVVEEALAAL